MFKYLFASIVAVCLAVTPVISQGPAASDKESKESAPQAAPLGASPNKVEGLELPADQTVSFDEGFVPVQAQCKGEVKWLVVSQVKVKYVTVPGNSIIISVPPQGGVISVFAVGLVDGKLTDFARTNITVQGGTPGPAPGPAPGPGPGPTPAPAGGPLHVTFVVDVNNTTPELALVLNSQTVQQAVKSKGNFLRLYDLKSPVLAQRKLDAVVNKVGGSAVMIIQDSAGKVLDAVAIPRTETEVLAIINKHAGGR